MAICRMSESPFPSQNQDKFVLRLPHGMRDRIKAAAEANNRSMNAEIVATLEEKYPAPISDPLHRALEIAEAMFQIASGMANSENDHFMMAISLSKIHELEREFEALKAVSPALQHLSGPDVASVVNRHRKKR